MANFTQHSVLARLAHQPVVRELYVSEKIHAPVILHELNFVRMQTQLQLFLQKLLDGGEEVLQLRFVGRDDNKIVGVANVVRGFQFVFYKLVELVHVDVCEQLRSQVADRYASRMEEIALTGRKAADYFFEQLHYFRIFNALRQYVQQYFVVDAVKKLPYVALKGVALACAIVTHRAEHICQSLHAFVRAFADTAGEGVGDKAWLEHGIEGLKNSMVQNSVAHRCFVYMSQLRVGDIKGGVRAVLVHFISEVAVQLKNMLLHFLLELHDVCLGALFLLELVPRAEEMLGRGHVFKYSPVRFHI